ncbi:MAG: hypothetical protein EOP54_13830, partial [Sphingobacteriales bacterium]
QVDNGNIALGSMPHGEYVLYIKGCNNDEVFSLEEKLIITVLPFWYEEKWFMILCIATVGITIFLLVRRRIAFIRNQFLFKQKLSESELKAIRAQMNPHFIFNVLNSIESYVMDNEKRKASRLIQKFAALSRLILENSTKALVSGDKEWKALMLYTELEAMRYDDAFSYTFTVDEAIQLRTLLLPPMLIQPLIENAILHGLIIEPKAGAYLAVALQKREDGFCITVEDNGIGIGNIAKSRGTSSVKELSLGLASIKERIEMINHQQPGRKASFTIRPGIDGRGTIATICLPFFRQQVSLDD